MRKHLLETFDSIYILDLHGSNKKKETAPNGSKDENVFDIMQGVSINIFIKNRSPIASAIGDSKKAEAFLLQSPMAQLYHFDLYGLREEKYQALLNSSIQSIAWNKIDCRAPEYFFIAKDIKVQEEYNKGFSVNELFTVNSSGIKTHRDDFVIDIDKDNLTKRIKKFYDFNFSESEIKTKFELKDNRDWSLSEARTNEKFKPELIKEILYRSFDYRKIYYSSNLIDFDRKKIMQHFLKGDNLGLISCRQQSTFNFQHIFVTNLISDLNSISLQTKEISFVFPLYLYPETENQQSTEETSHRIPNIDNTLIKKIAKKLGLTFTDEKETKPNTFAPIDILDYIYTILHSPNYRETYKEFLKTDFPRVPYADINNFWQLVELGSELRQLHLLESPALDQLITSYPKNGLNCITNKINKNSFELKDNEKQYGQIWINPSQYFDNVPFIAWEFYVGGYQPVQKWLKDRQGRVLSFDDILHYQKMIKALTETARIMQEIDVLIV